MCPLRGDRTRGLAPFVGIGEASFRAEPMTGRPFNPGRRLHTLLVPTASYFSIHRNLSERRNTDWARFTCSTRSACNGRDGVDPASDSWSRGFGRLLFRTPLNMTHSETRPRGLIVLFPILSRPALSPSPWEVRHVFLSVMPNWKMSLIMLHNLWHM